MDTLDLEQAANVLKIHKETLRQKANAGEIPGTKIGRAWVFIHEDLICYIRTRYDVSRLAVRVPDKRENFIWQSSAEVKHGISTLQRPMDNEYEGLLGL